MSRKAIELEPDNYVAYYHWGEKLSSGWCDGTTTEWHGGKKQLLKVVELTTEAIKIDPKDINALWYRGNAYERLNFAVEAINDFSKVIDIEPDNVEVYKRRADLKFYCGNSKSEDLLGAIDDYSKIIDLTNDKNYCFVRAWAKKELHLYHEAIEDYTLGIEAGIDDYYFERARVKEIVYDFEGAIEDYLKGIEIAPTFRCYMGLCKIYYNRNEIDQAQEYFDKAIELAPDIEEKEMKLYFKNLAAALF